MECPEARRAGVVGHRALRCVLNGHQCPLSTAIGGHPGPARTAGEDAEPRYLTGIPGFGALSVATPYKVDDQLAFCTARRTGHDHRNFAGRVLARAVKRADLAPPAPTFHSLRHLHASALIAGGRHIAQVSARLRHTSPAITAAIYTHHFDAANRSDARRESLATLYAEAGPRSMDPGRVAVPRIPPSSGAEIDPTVFLPRKAPGGA